MATNTYVLVTQPGVTSTPTTIYTVPGAVNEAMVISLLLTNVSNTSDVKATVTIKDVSNQSSLQNVKLCNSMFLPRNSNFNVLNDNNRLILNSGDQIIVSSDQASASIDVLISVMEIR